MGSGRIVIEASILADSAGTVQIQLNVLSDEGACAVAISVAVDGETSKVDQVD